MNNSFQIHSTLIVEDDQVASFLNHLLVDELNFSKEIITAGDGDEAMEKLETTDIFPELIFLDLKMPGMDGFEFLSKFQEKYSDKDSKIVIVSSSVDRRDREFVNQYKVFDFVVKPLTKEKVKELIARI